MFEGFFPGFDSVDTKSRHIMNLSKEVEWADFGGRHSRYYDYYEKGPKRHHRARELLETTDDSLATFLTTGEFGSTDQLTP